MVRKVEGDNYELGEIINDGDSTLMANIKEKVNIMYILLLFLLKENYFHKCITMKLILY